MPLTSKITSYNSEWPRLFAAEHARLRPIFGSACTAIHHVGSTAVRGLAAKPEIDVLVVVGQTRLLHEWSVDLAGLGYKRGGDLVKDHHFFKRDMDGERTHKLHLCKAGHPQINRMLAIRDHLRTSAQDRAAYAALKLRLEAENTSGIAEYLSAKAPFLDALYLRCQSEKERVKGSSPFIREGPANQRRG